ncbi:MAG: hypothetical protein ABJF01_24805 [bacterium]
MSYLFQGAVEPAIEVELMRGNATYLKGLCEKKTRALVAAHGRDFNAHDDYEFANNLIRSMGAQFKPKAGGWAGEYVNNWRMVSSNAGIVRGMVAAELHTAYKIGLDIRSEEVIGEMFDLAVQVWSTIGEYTGPSQNEGRR